MGEGKGYIKNSDEKGSVNISEDVVAVIAATAAIEVEGVHGLYYSHGREITTVAGRRGLTKGVRLSIKEDGVTIDIYVVVDMGYPVSEVGAEIQKAVISAVESAVGATVNAANVHISGVSLKKSK